MIVIGDIHGNISALEDFIDFYLQNCPQEKLIFLGDIIDRGPDPFACSHLLKNLNTISVVNGERVSVENPIILRGNHEQLMLDSLDDGWKWETWVHYQNGDTTVESWRSRFIRHAVSRSDFKELLEETGWLNWFDSLPFYHEEEIGGKKILFCHAGIHPEGSKETNFSRPGQYKLGEDDLSVIWIREHFFSNPGTPRLLDELGYTKVFIGHTPTISDRVDGFKRLVPDLLHSPKLCCNDMVVMCDTGSGYRRGLLTAVRIDDNLDVSIAWQEKGKQDE